MKIYLGLYNVVPSNLELLFLVKIKLFLNSKKDSIIQKILLLAETFFVQDTQMKLYKRL
jgi:hypothetical protein